MTVPLPKSFSNFAIAASSAFSFITCHTESSPFTRTVVRFCLLYYYMLLELSSNFFHPTPSPSFRYCFSTENRDDKTIEYPLFIHHRGNSLEQTWKNSLNVWVITEYDTAQALHDKVLFSITYRTILSCGRPGCNLFILIPDEEFLHCSQSLSGTSRTIFSYTGSKFLFHHHCGQHKYIRTAFSTLL